MKLVSSSSHCCLLVLLPLLRSYSVSAQCHVTYSAGVRTANCTGRSLRSVPSAQAADIRVLRLADNLMTSLAADSFRSYGSSLTELNLARNHISSIDDSAFRGLQRIQIVDLEANSLQLIPTAALRHLATVRIIVFKKNSIRSIGINDLDPLVNVQEVNFENCGLERIAAGAFSRLSRLHELNLADNELTTLEPETENQLPASLTVVRLTGNPWLCDCRLRWLRKWLASSASGESGNITSSSAPKFSLSAFNWDLAPSLPTCSGPADSRTFRVGNDWRSIEPRDGLDLQDHRMAAGKLPEIVVAIRCIASGDPLPVITWSLATANGTMQLTSNTKMAADAVGSVDVLQTLNEHHEPVAESVLTITEDHYRYTSGPPPTNYADFYCQAENSAGKAEAPFRVDDPRSSSRFISLPTSYDRRRVEHQAATSGSVFDIIGPEVLISCGLFTVGLLTVLVICVVCWTATITRSRRYGDDVITKKSSGSADVGTSIASASVSARPESADTMRHVTESVLSSVNTGVVLQRDTVRPSTAVWGSFIRSKSSCATHPVGNAALAGMVDPSETGSISLRHFDTRSVYSCGGLSEYEAEVLENKMTTDFHFRLFEPRKPWSVSDGDVRLVPTRDSCCSAGLVAAPAYDRRRMLLSARQVRQARDFRSRTGAGVSNSRWRPPAAATRLQTPRNEWNVGGTRCVTRSTSRPQNLYGGGLAAPVALEYRI